MIQHSAGIGTYHMCATPHSNRRNPSGKRYNYIFFFLYLFLDKCEHHASAFAHIKMNHHEYVISKGVQLVQFDPAQKSTQRHQAYRLFSMRSMRNACVFVRVLFGFWIFTAGNEYARRLATERYEGKSKIINHEER